MKTTKALVAHTGAQRHGEWFLRRLVVPTGPRGVIIQTEETDWIEAERNCIPTFCARTC
jgi:hypothetical protein